MPVATLAESYFLWLQVLDQKCQSLYVFFSPVLIKKFFVMALGLLIPSHNLRYLSFVLNGAFHLNASRVFFCCTCSDKTFEEVRAGHLFVSVGIDSAVHRFLNWLSTRTGRVKD